MTLRAIVGLVVLNAFVLAVGAGVLWGIRGWRWWTELGRLAGVAYFLGLSALLVVTMLELVLGIPLEPVTVVVSGVAIAALGVVVGRRRGFAAPGLRPSDWRFPGISLFAAVFAAGIVVWFEALLRAGRLAGVAREWDSWANWLPKSRSLYLTGELDLDFLALVPQLTSYPPGHTTLQALSFHAMGSADTVTLHLQYWFMAAFFVAGAIGLLGPRVRGAILFPVLLAFLVAPYLLDWLTTVYADIPMGYFVALAALLLLLWVEERAPWQLAAATLLFAGAMLTKREGLVFVGCVLLAALVATFRERGIAWRRLFVAGLAAFALVLPWRIWFTYHGLPGDGPDIGYLGAFDHLDRVWPALEITVRSFFHQDLWHLAPVVGVAAIAVALAARAWRPSLFAATFLVAGVGAVTWMLWSNLGLALIHEDWAVRRFTGTLALVLGVLTPFLLQRAWSAGASPAVAGVLFRPMLAGWAIVAVGLLSHPGSALLGHSGSGLPGGWMSFPDCEAEGVRVVGYADSYPEAERMRERAQVSGLSEVQVARDGCGRVRVFVDDAP